MININCTLNDCIFECEGKCTLTHVSTPSSIYNPECIYFRPKDEVNTKSYLYSKKYSVDHHSI